jgi:hypothetical protein
MNQKTLVWIGMFVGSTVGSYLPLLWGAGFLSLSSVLLSGAGGILGIWLGFKLGQ